MEQCKTSSGTLEIDTSQGLFWLSHPARLEVESLGLDEVDTLIPSFITSNSRVGQKCKVV